MKLLAVVVRAGSRGQEHHPAAGGQGGVGRTSAHTAPCRSRAGRCRRVRHHPTGLNRRALSFWEAVGRRLFKALGNALGCLCLQEKKQVMSQIRLSGRMNGVVARMGDAAVGCNGRIS